VQPQLYRILFDPENRWVAARIPRPTRDSYSVGGFDCAKKPACMTASRKSQEAST
jgi:hypothetical protein